MTGNQFFFILILVNYNAPEYGSAESISTGSGSETAKSMRIRITNTAQNRSETLLRKQCYGSRGCIEGSDIIINWVHCNGPKKVKILERPKCPLSPKKRFHGVKNCMFSLENENFLSQPLSPKKRFHGMKSCLFSLENENFWGLIVLHRGHKSNLWHFCNLPQLMAQKTWA
jgi:hypothetical protein